MVEEKQDYGADNSQMHVHHEDLVSYTTPYCGLETWQPTDISSSGRMLNNGLKNESLHCVLHD